MIKFAVIENNIVTNIIVAESKLDAEQITNLLCVEIIDERHASIGATYDDGHFITEPLYPSWIYDRTTKNFKPPVEYPDVDENERYIWNENTLSWDLLSN
jgi:hypothetical protein